MDFQLDSKTENYRKRYRQFVRERLVPLDGDPASFDEHENVRLDLLETLRAEAKTAGLWTPQMPRELGGQGETRRAAADDQDVDFGRHGIRVVCDMGDGFGDARVARTEAVQVELHWDPG